MEEKKEQVKQLKQQLTGDMMKDFELQDQIHQLEMEINNVKPMDSHIDCVGCGA